MATKVQKKVLWWMIDNGGELYITTGHKRVLYAHTDAFGKPGEMFCRGNECLIGGLLSQGYAVRMFEYGNEHTLVSETVNGVVVKSSGTPLTQEQKTLLNRFRITDAGRKAAGTNRPDLSEHSNVPHRNKLDTWINRNARVR